MLKFNIGSMLVACHDGNKAYELINQCNFWFAPSFCLRGEDVPIQRLRYESPPFRLLLVLRQSHICCLNSLAIMLKAIRMNIRLLIVITVNRSNRNKKSYFWTFLKLFVMILILFRLHDGIIVKSLWKCKYWRRLS